ncbi:MAG: hypothetical protein ACAF42_18905 [Limnothrix sp. BL-A-16]
MTVLDHLNLSRSPNSNNAIAASCFRPGLNEPVNPFLFLMICVEL